MSAASAPRPVSHLKVLSAGAVKYVVTDFAPKFTRETGDRIEFTFGTIGGVQQRLANGETADIIMGTAPAVAQMEQAGVLVAGSRTELGRTLTGICVRDVTPMPDIATPESFKPMTGSNNREAAGRFIAMLTAPAQHDAWMSLGFEPAGRG